MYKAQELYPLNREDVYVYETLAVKARLASVGYAKRKKLKMTEYLNLAEECRWDLSHDVNYAYAAVLYPPAELKRRLLRITRKNITESLEDIAFDCGMGFHQVAAVIRYGKRRTMENYALFMKLLSKWEQGIGYSDALEFED